MNFACIEGYDKFIEKLALDEKNQYKWIGEWEAGINEFKEKLKIADLNEKKLRKKYKSMEEEVNELDNLLVLAKKDAFCTLWRSQMRFRAVALRSITAARF